MSQSDKSEYRIEFGGDGDGVVTVIGWDAVIEAVTNDMYSEPTDEDRADVLDMLANGFDGGSGWNGNRASFQFEDGFIAIDLIEPVASASDRPA